MRHKMSLIHVHFNCSTQFLRFNFIVCFRPKKRNSSQRPKELVKMSGVLASALGRGSLLWSRGGYGSCCGWPVVAFSNVATVVRKHLISTQARPTVELR